MIALVSYLYTEMMNLRYFANFFTAFVGYFIYHMLYVTIVYVCYLPVVRS
jgi:hypothetical protein